MLVVVPTAQSGRRLREALAEGAGALLSPRITTPGSLLQSRDGEAAPAWVERAAWMETMESIPDWSIYSALFPERPGEGRDWSEPLAREMTGLRQHLQENGLLLSTGAKRMRDTVEAERWEAMGRLESLVERQLQFWGMKSRSRILAEGPQLPPDTVHVVLAGVAELPPLLSRALENREGPVTVLIGAPESESAGFSLLGKPVPEVWAERELLAPHGTLQVVADPRQQAVEALRVVGHAGSSSDDVVLGSADTEAGDELARVFTREGWIAFHPAAAAVTGGLAKWFRIWSKWQAEPTLATLADLLALPETGVLVGGRRAGKAKILAELRDRWMVLRTEDLRRRVESESFRDEETKADATEILDAAEKLEGWRRSLAGKDFCGVMVRLLEVLSRREETEEMSGHMVAWLEAARPMMEKVDRGPAFWIGQMVAEAPVPVPEPPEGRIIDVQGWLELFHEAGSHLVLCGMNEGKVPARSGGEPWLSEAGRVKLGLTTDADRAARDAYLYQAMLEARRSDGRVDVICGKAGSGGEPLLPSRLLLAASREDLPSRVKLLFKEVEPPEAGMRWHADWLWTPRPVDLPQRLNVTSLGDYLACPFRYYLKHAVKMQQPEPGRTEWNARDFGTVAHDILEHWGRDTEARESESEEEIHAWLSHALDETAARWFGTRIPLSVRIQMEALRQRFRWLARVQAANRSEGWQIVDVERKVEIPVGDALIVAKIDRIDRHRETGQYRVLDYKTGKVNGVDKAHRRKLSANSVLAEHLSGDTPAIYEADGGGKSARFLWTNLQLPLYAAAIVQRGMDLPVPCYFTLRSTEGEVAIHEWSDFGSDDLDAARSCADWVAGQIAAGVFWPPAERVMYDDYSMLSAGRGFSEMFTEPGVVV